MPIQATLTIFSSKKIKLNKRLRPPEKSQSATGAHAALCRAIPGQGLQIRTGQRPRQKMARLSALMEAVPEAEHPASLHFPRLPFLSSGKDVLKIDRLAVGYEFPLMQPLNLFLKRGQRLAIV